MTNPVLNPIYWEELKNTLLVFSEKERLERYLFNIADFEEIINRVFDDLNAIKNFNRLPEILLDSRLKGLSYLEKLNYLVGSGSNITREAPIYNLGERVNLYSETNNILKVIDDIILISQKY